MLKKNVAPKGWSDCRFPINYRVALPCLTIGGECLERRWPTLRGIRAHSMHEHAYDSEAVLNWKLHNSNDRNAYCVVVMHCYTARRSVPDRAVVLQWIGYGNLLSANKLLIKRSTNSGTISFKRHSTGLFFFIMWLSVKCILTWITANSCTTCTKETVAISWRSVDWSNLVLCMFSFELNLSGVQSI